MTFNKKREFSGDAEKIIAEAHLGITSTILSILPTIELKNASASRAGNKIQARLLWVENGKKTLGYFSFQVHDGKLPVMPVPFAVVNQAMKLHNRAARFLMARVPVLGAGDATRRMVNEIVDRVHRDLTDSPKTLDRLIPINREMHTKMAAVLRAGGHSTARRSRNQTAARKALARNLDFALGSGIQDDELRDMLKEAIVRHTMDS